MYAVIGMLIGMMTAFSQDTTSTTQGYNLQSESVIREAVIVDEGINTASDTLIKSNQVSLSSAFGDEKSKGRNWASILTAGFLPTGFIPESQMSSTNELERGIIHLS